MMTAQSVYLALVVTAVAVTIGLTYVSSNDAK